MTTDREMTDVLAAVAGDSSAIERVLLANYDWLEGRVHSLLPGWLRATVSAEDVCQDVAVAVFRAIGTYQPATIAHFRAWLNTIAEHRVTEAIRHAKRQKRGGNVPQVSQLGDDDCRVEPSCCDDDTDPRLDALHGAIKRLPKLQRTVVWRYLIDGASLDEVAAEIGRSRDGVRAIAHRAKKALEELVVV